jgi:hypothetical protein
VASLHYLLAVSCALSARLSSWTGHALIDLALEGKQTGIGASLRIGGWRYLVFHFMEVERMKDAGEAWGKAVAVDRKKWAKTEMTLNLDSTRAAFSILRLLWTIS